MEPIAADSAIRRTVQHLETPLDGETIIMHLKSGMIYAVADTANVIWSELRQPLLFAKLIDQLLQHFEVDRETCTRDVSAFLQELKRLEIIEIEAANG